MKYLYTTCGTQFQVSDEDEIFLAGFTWKLQTKGYVQVASGKCKNQLIHRIIAERMGLDFPNLIDHKDRNPLNNQRDNLRPATYSQNAMNSKISKRNTSGLKGVYWDKQKQKWVAQITINGKQIRLGFFDIKEEAHQVYCEAVTKHFGEFANERSDMNDFCIPDADNELLQQLAEIEGFDDTLELLQEYSIESIVPGICTTPGCSYSNEVEPDQTEGWCEECQKGTVKSAFILAGVI